MHVGGRAFSHLINMNSTTGGNRKDVLHQPPVLIIEGGVRR